MNEDNPAPVVDEPAAGPVVDEPSTDDQEWDSAAEEFNKDNGIEKEEPKDEPEQPEEPAEEPKTEEAEPGDKEEPVEEEAPEVPEKIDEPVDPRTAIREMEAERKEMIDDVRKQIYGDKPPELTDSDGDPIRTIQDVTKLMNPKTGVAFTETEAAVWLLNAQKNFEQTQEKTNAEIEQIAEVNLALKDSADKTVKKYTSLFEKRPELKQQVWQNYQKTLTVDPKTNVIIGAPITPEEFYDTALGGYVEQESQAQLDAAKATEAEAEAERVKAEAAKKEEEHKEEIAKVRSRNDREDILSTSKPDTRSKEDKEWADAAKEYYEE